VELIYGRVEPGGVNLSYHITAPTRRAHIPLSAPPFLLPVWWWWWWSDRRGSFGDGDGRREEKTLVVIVVVIW